MARLPEANKAAYRQMFATQQAVTRMMRQSGAIMLAGSDTGVASVWVIPGFGRHEEFRELAAAGLSNLDILQMATLNGAQFLHREASMGAVEEGKNADLLLLDANPIADVLLKGRYLDRDGLAKMKSDTATAFRNAKAGALIPPGNGHMD